MNEQDNFNEEEKIFPVFFKYLRDTKSLWKTTKLTHEWFEAHGGACGIVNANNYHEAELERDTLEERIKDYGLNREDFQETFDYYDELIEAGKRKEAENPPEFTMEELICHLNAIAADFDQEGLDYDAPDFFDDIERRRKKHLESVFKFGKYTDLDYGDPMVTHKLAERIMKRIKNGEITVKDLLKFLEDC